jgi:hypothetical protein
MDARMIQPDVRTPPSDRLQRITDGPEHVVDGAVSLMDGQDGAASADTGVVDGRDRAVDGSGIDISAFVKAGASQCLTRYPNLKVQAGTYQNAFTLSVPANRSVDMRGVHVFGQSPNHVEGHGQIARFLDTDGVCILGGKYESKQDPLQVFFRDMKTKGIHAAIYLGEAKGPITIERVVVDKGGEDGIRLPGDVPDRVSLTVRDVWLKGVAADGIENDGGKKLPLIENSLFETSTFISTAPGADSPDTPGAFGSQTVTVRNTLVDMTPRKDDRPDGSTQRDTVRAKNNNCGDNMTVGTPPIKGGPAARDIRYEMSNVIFRMVCRPRQQWGTFPAGTYDNVLVVYDPLPTAPATFGMPLMPGMTLVTGQQGRDVWNKARAEWLRLHGCDVNATTCTFPEP